MSEERYKRKEAFALSYNPEVSDAPKVIAKGKGKIAENILERAEEHDIPIQEDPSLLELLGQLNVNETIPEELYQAVSEVFAYIYRLDKEKGRKNS
ncbi:hypothetical protein CSV79_00805 [Sporosarcina sp. P13]|uniref:EscU/YscU/HrcU family type III secretion system export apparatus switch protein n=1 Tax=Sporosarcina sp. P13 TaxID=2048263 RepID=UPI000C172359|nr:EscU/YscU/HrcU family type III secretion system export apparatus switch protein [Sporosarcina sp. P13]PIC65648.1 hypothetical protein CSV79_00805 [Sporosarcina sp. P13]